MVRSMTTTKTRGRPKGNKVHFQARVTPEQLDAVRRALEKPTKDNLTQAVYECKGDVRIAGTEGELLIAQEYGKVMSSEVSRLEGENESLQSQIKELQAGITDPYVRNLRALVSKQQMEIARLS